MTIKSCSITRHVAVYIWLFAVDTQAEDVWTHTEGLKAVRVKVIRPN